MYIKRIEINSFGKFNNFSYDFSEGLNYIVKENEFGKTTIVDFIYFVFYDFEKASRKKSYELRNDLFNKYLPIDNTPVLSGAVEIFKDGVLFRVERQSSKPSKSDVFIINLQTMEKIRDVVPGEFFFGVDKETFLKTFYIRQSDNAFSKTDGLDNAIKNLALTGDENYSIDNILQNLANEKKKYQHGDRKSGPIFDLQKEIAVLKLDLSQKKSEILNYDDAHKKYLLLSNELDKINSDIAQNKQNQKIAIANDAKTRVEKINEIELKLSQSQNQISLSDREKINESLNSLDVLTAVLIEKENLLNDKEASLNKKIKDFDNYDVIKENHETLIKKSKFPFNLLNILGSMLIIFSVSSLFLLRELKILCPIGIIIGALLFIPFITFKSSNLIKKLGIKKQGDIISLISKYDAFKNIITAENMAINSLKDEILFSKSRLDNLNCEITSLLKKNNIASKDEFFRIKNSFADLSILKDRLSEILNGKEKSYYEALIKDSNPLVTEDIEKTGKNLDELYIKKDEVSLSLKSAKNDYDTFLSLKDEILKAENDIDKKSKLLSEMQFKNEALKIAMDVMNESYKNLSLNKTPKINKLASEILSKVTNGKYDEVFLDSLFNIKIKFLGKICDIDYLSSGTLDAVYFALRYAVCKSAYPQENHIFILDDPFITFDMERNKHAKSLLQSAFEGCQILFFSARE